MDLLHCPTCETKLRVTNTRPCIMDGVLSVVRYRKCDACGYIRKTAEIPVDDEVKILWP